MFRSLTKTLKSNQSSSWSLFLPSGATTADGLHLVPGGDLRELDANMGQVNYGTVRELSTGEFIPMGRWRSYGLGSLAISLPDSAALYMDRIINNPCPLPVQRRYGIDGDNWELAEHAACVGYLNRRSESPTASGPTTGNAPSTIGIPGVFTNFARLRNIPPLVIKVDLPHPIVGATFVDGDFAHQQTIVVSTWRNDINTLALYQSDNLGVTWTQINSTTQFNNDLPASRLFSFYNRLFTCAVYEVGGFGGPTGVHYDIDRGTWYVHEDEFISSSPMNVEKFAYSGNRTNTIWGVQEVDNIWISEDNGYTWQKVKVEVASTKIYDLAAGGRFAAVVGVRGSTPMILWDQTHLYIDQSWGNKVDFTGTGAVSVGIDVHNPYEPSNVWVYVTVINEVESEDIGRYIDLRVLKSDNFLDWLEVYQEIVDVWGSSTPPGDEEEWAPAHGVFTTHVSLDGYHVWLYARLAHHRRLTLRSIDGGITWVRHENTTGTSGDDNKFCEFIVNPNDINMTVILQDV